MIQTSRGTYNKEKHMIIQDIFKPPSVDTVKQTFSCGAVFKPKSLHQLLETTWSLCAFF